MAYSYDYGYGYAGPDEAMMEEMMLEMMSGIGVAFLGVVIVIALVALAVSVATYVLKSIGIYTIAKRRGIRNAWLAWIPVGTAWIEGSISDQYQYVVKGRIRNRRVVLLMLSAAAAVFGVLTAFIDLLPVAMDGSQDLIAVGTMVGVLVMIANSVLSIVYAVFYYMAMYDLYTSCSPQNNVMFLVLSILFRITEPFFIFFNRNKDDGMPPRREEPQICIPEPVTEPWENV